MKRSMDERMTDHETFETSSAGILQLSRGRLARGAVDEAVASKRGSRTTNDQDEIF